MENPTLSFFILLILVLTSCANGNQSTDQQDTTSVAATSTQAVLAKHPTNDAITSEPEEQEVAKKAPAVAEKTKKTEQPKVTPKSNQAKTTTEKPPQEEPPSITIEDKPSTAMEDNTPAPIAANTPIKKAAEPTPELVVQEPPLKQEEPKVVFSHDLWDQLLRKYVSASGKVNYNGFRNDKAQLQQYLDLLAANPPQSSWSRGKRLAYWINAYNAFTVKLIVDNYPVSSITKLHGGKPWDRQWIKLGSNTYSLNAIENDIIRPKFQEPRIHFAVNCAAKSCPPLLNKAWTADNLERNFEKQTKAFINNSQQNSLKANAVQLSKIFEWYKQDFGNLTNFLNKYSDIQINANAKVSYKEYDWALNN